MEWAEQCCTGQAGTVPAFHSDSRAFCHASHPFAAVRRPIGGRTTPCSNPAPRQTAISWPVTPSQPPTSGRREDVA
jgi:hypothetical protein